MNHINVAIELERNKEVFRHLLHGLSKDQYTWKPAPSKWCLLEIACHLYDEEREDFRARIQSVLDDPNRELSPIDPAGWVEGRMYLQQDMEEKLHAFLVEREGSVAYLNALVAPDWTRTNFHPKLGPVPASVFLYNWLAHDYHHIRQINALKYAYLTAQTNDPLNYAGNW